MDDDNDSEGTETPSGAGGSGPRRNPDGSMIDDVGAQDAFIAGMIYALSRRICPGLPFTPAWNGEEVNGSMDDGRAKWRLDECLRLVICFRSLEYRANMLFTNRFATELAGRKARRKATRWSGLADEMTQAGWFET